MRLLLDASHWQRPETGHDARVQAIHSGDGGTTRSFTRKCIKIDLDLRSSYRHDFPQGREESSSGLAISLLDEAETIPLLGDDPPQPQREPTEIQDAVLFELHLLLCL